MTSPPAPPELRVLDGSSVTRTIMIKPAMCGHNSLFVGQIGDWTWDTVSALCDTNVFAARDCGGVPTYLSFSYFHLRASPSMHVRHFTFGDILRVDSRLFGFGSESVLALHEIRMAGRDAETSASARRIEPEEFYAFPDENCLYVQNFNRWVARSRAHSNEGLRRASPVDFRHNHLPVLDSRHSPRLAYDRVRRTVVDGRTDRPAGGVTLTVDYPIDVTRDLNGVGLLYFAAYFSIIDWGLLRLWRHLGRTDRSFLRRVVLDQRVCYLGNADVDCVLRIELSRLPMSGKPADEYVEAVLTDRDSGRVIAVSTLHVRTEGAA